MFSFLLQFVTWSCLLSNAIINLYQRKKVKTRFTWLAAWNHVKFKVLWPLSIKNTFLYYLFPYSLLNANHTINVRLSLIAFKILSAPFFFHLHEVNKQHSYLFLKMTFLCRLARTGWRKKFQLKLKYSKTIITDLMNCNDGLGISQFEINAKSAPLEIKAKRKISALRNVNGITFSLRYHRYQILEIIWTY